MTQNELQLNDEKTELLLACPKKFVDHPSLPTFLEIGNTSTVPFSSSVRSLGVTLDPTLSFQQHISNVFRSAYLELRKISSVRHLLSAEATTTLVCAFIFSKLDYCNSLFAGLPKYLIHRLQRIQNNAARLVFKSSKFEHVSPLLHSLHWLPISDRIDYKISSPTHSAICGTGPEYLSELLLLAPFVLHLILDFSVFPLSGQKPTDNDLSPTRPLQHGITYQLLSDTQSLSLLLKLHLKHMFSH